MLLKCLSIVAYSSFWRTPLCVLCMLTVAFCSTSGFRMVYWVLHCIYTYIYIYLYICSSVCVQECLLLYMHICRPYMYILGLENIYMDHIYTFSMLFGLFACLVDAAYECKCMFHCTSDTHLSWHSSENPLETPG